MTASFTTDVIIIGAGPVGLFAVFQCGMLGMRCHVVDSLEAIGGQCTALYPEKPIYDIPGFAMVTGADLITRLEDQARPFKPTYHLNQQATVLTHHADQSLTLSTSTGTQITACAIIIAAGAGAFGPNKPPLQNLNDYEGTSVFYMVKSRAHFSGKKIVIAGGGDSAVDWALSLSDIAEKISVVHRRDNFKAAPDSVIKLKSLAVAGKIDLIIPYQLHALSGADGQLTAVTVRDLDGGEKTITADILLPFFGLTPQLGPLNDWNLNIHNFSIPVDAATMRTQDNALFAIGDVAQYPGKLKLILTGFAEAAIAAHNAHALVFPGKEIHFIHSTTKGVP